MKKEWFYKVAGDGTPGDRKSSPAKPRKPRDNLGCMTTIFNLFDLQHHYPSFVVSESAGVQPPRNTSDSPESAMDAPKQQQNVNIPMGGIQIKTKRSRFSVDDLSSECSSSPGTKTPNLVARLMGLDLLPENRSPRPSSSSTTPTTHRLRCRSLPATPRTSTASRRSTDIDFHHRLSLQIDKENHNCRTQEQKLLPVKTARPMSELLVNRREDESKSQYAKQITNKVRERISRRVGMDITNTVGKNGEERRDSDLVLLKAKREPKQDEIKKKPISKTESKGRPLMKVKKGAGERYELRLKKEARVKKKNKSTPLSNLNNATKFISLNKEMMSSSTSTAILPQKQVSLVSMTQLPSTPNPSYNTNHTTTDHFDYIPTILNTTPEKPSTDTVGRRLIFDLVNEFLPEILNPYTNPKPCESDLIRKLCDRIRNIPATDCQALEDIDRLIDGDIGRSMRRIPATAMEELVREVEGDIVERLVHEVVIGRV